MECAGLLQGGREPGTNDTYYDDRLKAHVLDPRFPDVREALVTFFDRAVREWDVDGFKLDFLDQFVVRGRDPALDDDFAGRDFRSLPLAVDCLCAEIVRRSKAQKPNLLVEFRQPYTGPSARAHGNMFRASDCPMDPASNRERIARLRLLAGRSAVHGDMIRWNAGEVPEQIAEHILSSIFGAVQYSVVLKDATEEERRIIAFWAEFANEHKDALLCGEFRPYRPAQGYPVIEGKGASERIVGVYAGGQVVRVEAADKTVYVLNASGEDCLCVDLCEQPNSVEVRNVFGRVVAQPKLSTGLCRVNVPRSGYLKLSYGVFGRSLRVPEIPDRAMSLAIDGQILYCGAGDSLYVLDISSPMAPRLLKKADGFTYLRQIQVQDGLLAVSSRGAGAWLVDVRDPVNPKVLSRFDTVEQATGIELAGELMFVGERCNGVEIVDISNPKSPEHVRMVQTPESQSCRYVDGRLYSGDWHSGSVCAIDIEDLTNAYVVGVAKMHGYCDGFDLEGRYLYAATGHHLIRSNEKSAQDPENFGKGHGLEVWDYADAAHPRFVSRVSFPAYWRLQNDMWSCRESSGWAFCSDTYNGLFAVDVRNVRHPVLADRMCFPNPNDPKAPSFCVSSVAIGNGVIYATTDGGGLWVVKCLEAISRPQQRGRLPQGNWRDPYPTSAHSHFDAWLPPARGRVLSAAFSKDLLYVGCANAGAYVVDARNLKTCARISSEYSRGVDIRGNHLYVAHGMNGLAVYSLDNPLAPKEIRRIREFGHGVSSCQWIHVPTDRWAVLHPRMNESKWRILDLLSDPAAVVCTVRGMDWVDPFAELVGGRYLPYARTHGFFSWLDLSADRPVEIDTADPAGTGPLNRRANFIRSQGACCAFGRDRVLVSNGRGGCFFLASGQKCNADGSPWPTLGVRAAEGSGMVDVEGYVAYDGDRTVAFAANQRRCIQLVDFTDEKAPCLIWQERTRGCPERPIFANGELFVPCGYQGLLKRVR